MIARPSTGRTRSPWTSLDGVPVAAPRKGAGSAGLVVGGMECDHTGAGTATGHESHAAISLIGLTPASERGGLGPANDDDERGADALHLNVTTPDAAVPLPVPVCETGCAARAANIAPASPHSAVTIAHCARLNERRPMRCY